MKLGLCTISNKEFPVERVLDIAAGAGYDGVEIWGDEAHIGDGSPDRCDAIALAAKGRSLDVAVYGSYLAPGTETFADEYEHELAVADRIGADLLRVWPGDSEYGDQSDEEWDAVIDDLRLLARRGATYGVGVTVEKHAGRLSNATEGAERLVEAVDHPGCGLNWQPLFDMSESELLTEAERLAPLTNNIHIQAPAERGGKERALLSQAYFDVGTVLEPFEATGFDGYVEVEFVTQDVEYENAVRQDYEYLRSVTELESGVS